MGRGKVVFVVVGQEGAHLVETVIDVVEVPLLISPQFGEQCAGVEHE